MPRHSKRAALLAIAIAALAGFVVHYPGVHADAFFLDDNQFLLDNPLVQNPGWPSAKRFITEVFEPSTVEGYYKPLTMISLMLDYARSGHSLDAAPYRLTNVLLHTANAGLLALLIYLLLGRPIAAGCAALLFAVHPVNVEAVIWIAERKTMLATFFALLSMIAYVRFAETRAGGWYAGCALAFVAAALAKPIVIMLPALLLILDVWPLRLINSKRDVLRMLIEKVPLFVIAAVFAAITFVSQTRAAGTQLPTQWSLLRMPLIICHNLVFYVRELLVPFGYYPFHPFPDPVAITQPAMIAGLIGTAVLIVALWLSVRRTRVAWASALFFVVAVFPTLGVIGFTIVIAADKYAYLPSIGVYIAVAGLLAWLIDRPAARLARVAVPAVVLAIAVVFTIGVNIRQRAWRTVDTLYARVMEMAPDAAIPRTNYGIIMYDRGEFAAAEKLYRESLRIRPAQAEAHNNLANALLAQGRPNEARAEFAEALNIWPDYPDAHVGYGYILSLAGDLEGAIQHERRALELDPENLRALNNLGNALVNARSLDEALEVFNRALALRPTDAETHNNIAAAYAAAGDPDRAIEHYRLAVNRSPTLLPAHYNLAELYRRTNRLTDARAAYTTALRLAESQHNPAAAARIRDRLSSLDQD